MGGEATRFNRRSQAASVSAAALEAALASSLRAELESSRWYQGKGRAITSLRLVDRIVIPAPAGGMLAIVGAGYANGVTDEYAMAVRADATGIVRGVGADDPLWPALARLAAAGGTIDGDHGTVEGAPGSPLERPLEGRTCRPLDADQSNTSLVLDGRVVLKCYRRLRQGTHPEQELLQGLTRVGSTRAPALVGALGYRRDGLTTAVATAYAYVEGEAVGWEPAIVGLVAALDGPATEVACVSFQATLAVLLLLAGHVAPGVGVSVAELRPAVDLAAALRDGRGDWLAEVAALVGGAELTQATAPASELVTGLVETGVAELVAAQIWGAGSG